MNNDLVNEVSNYRAEKLLNFSSEKITKSVRDAIEFLQPGAMNGLQGLDAEHDGLTKSLWQQAVQAAEMSGSLVFPQYRDDSGIPEDAEPVSYGDATCVIAGRVARAILIIDGYTDPEEGQDNWYQL